MELVHYVGDDSQDAYIVRFEGQLWVAVFNTDPAQDFVVDPTGLSRTDIWDPQGPYRHPMVPDRFFDVLAEHLEAIQ